MIKNIFIVLMALALLSMCCFTVPYVVLAGVAVDSFPAGKDKGEAWLLGTPQPVYLEGGIPVQTHDIDCGKGRLGCASNLSVWDGEQVPYQGVELNPEFLCVPPLQGGYISPGQYFGIPRDGSVYLHSGMDFIGGNRKVIAPMNGVVTWAAADEQWYYGNFVAIENNGYQMIFAHLDSLNVSEGQTVSAGQVLGIAGNTGNSFGVHLHFEIRRYDGDTQRWVPIDPLDAWLPGQTAYCHWDFPYVAK